MIESLFGHLSGRIKQDLPGAIKSSSPKDLRKAAKEACLIYEDIDRYIQQFILRYQYAEQKALEGMSPHQKWVEAIQRIGLPDFPALTPDGAFVLTPGSRQQDHHGQRCLLLRHALHLR